MPRGGRRKNAGRKPSALERKTAIAIAKPAIDAAIGKSAREAVTAAVVLASVDELQEWKSLIGNANTKLSAMIYLTDRRDGKPKQYTEVKDVTESTPERAERIAELVASATNGEIDPGRIGRA